MSDIFNRAADAFGGSFAADAARVTFAQPGLLSSVPAGGPGLPNPAAGAVGMTFRGKLANCSLPNRRGDGGDKWGLAGGRAGLF